MACSDISTEMPEREMKVMHSLSSPHLLYLIIVMTAAAVGIAAGRLF